jgi:signal transduction histidine kinase
LDPGAGGGRRNREAQVSATFERLLTRISTVFAGARWDRVNAEVDAALADMLAWSCVEQMSLFEVLPDNTAAYLRHVVRAADMPASPEQLNYGECFPWAFRKVVLAGEAMAFACLDDLQPEAAVDKASLQTLGLRSALHVPLAVEGEVRFVLAVACNRRTPDWSKRYVTRLKALGEILAHAISRAEAAAALLANQHDVRDVPGIARVGRWEWDIGADKLHLSDEAKHILGTDIPTLARLFDLIKPSDLDELQQAIERARANPGVRFQARYALHTPAGEARTIQQWHEVMFPGERTARLIATVQDVSASRDTEQEMTELRAHKWHSARVAQTALLVASLAHELSQPLAAILNNAQAGLRFLNSGNLTPEEMRDILTDIVASNRRASDVLSALRAMLRRQTTARVIFDAADAARDVLTLVRSELMSEQIEVETSLAPRCHLNADKTQIEQVILNLVMNSIDAMRGKRDASRHLRVTLLEAQPGEVEVSVNDSGRGIPPEKLDKVFEAFWTTKKKGLGMGLSVCRAIVESYGGRIWCETNAVGGVTFRFKLPLAEPQEPAMAASEPAGVLQTEVSPK